LLNNFFELEVYQFNGKLRIYSEPWFEYFEVSHTGPESVSIGAGVVKYLDHTEIVEFKKSQATVNYPIYSLQDIEWQYNNLGEVNWNKKVLSVNGDNQYSVATIRYTSRCIEFPVSHLLNNTSLLTQFVIIE